MADTPKSDQTASNSLRDDQYRDDRNLRLRSALYERSRGEPVGPGEFGSVFDDLEAVVPDNPVILEVGAGTGSLWVHNAERIPPGASLCVTDFSPGMLDIAKRRLAEAGIPARFELVDVQELPFPAASFDIVLADHMLYHVPDLSLALANIARVLRPGGTLIAVTNGQCHLDSLKKVTRRFLGDDCWPPLESFNLDNGSDLLLETFTDVEVHRRPGRIFVTEPELVVDYMRSMPQREGALDGESAVSLRAHLAAQIEAHGAFVVEIDVGTILARKPRAST